MMVTGAALAVEGPVIRPLLRAPTKQECTMRIGFLSTFDRERIAFARTHGFEAVELIVPRGTDYLPPNDGWKDKAAAVRGAYAEAGIRVSCIGGFYENHMDADTAVAEALFNHTRNVILLAEMMQVPVVAGFAGRLVDQPLEAALPKFQQIWSEHAAFAADRGIRIAYEHCPLGAFHSPFGGINCMCSPAMWERGFNEVDSPALGLEWDPSHLVCQFMDPIANLRRWGAKVYHVHGKDAKVYRDVMDQYGVYHPGAIEHCFPGLGDSDWGAIVKELRRAGYFGDINIEGWHDSVFVDRDEPGRPKLEDAGLLIALKHLSQFIP
jgi:sugar phosphate isomerase/epimerase